MKKHSSSIAEMVEDIRDSVTIKLVAPTALKAVNKRRFFYAEDAGRMWKVEVSPDLRVTCWCSKFWSRYQTGEGDVCEHVSDALEFIDAVGFARLSCKDRDVRPVKK